MLASLLTLAAASLLLWWWSKQATTESVIVIYLGRPWDVIEYVGNNWPRLAIGSLQCLLTALASLAIAGLLAITLIILGLFSQRGLSRIERVAAGFQTLPILVIVTVCFLLEREIFRLFNLEAPADVLCIAPVSLSLTFTPLVNGIAAAHRIPFSLRALLRLWDAQPLQRIWRIYLPYVMGDILTGIRASATWAVGAVLIAEGMVNRVVGSSDTLGHKLIRPFTSGNPVGETLSVIIISTALGYAVYRITVMFHSLCERGIYGEATTAQQAYPLQS